MMVCILGDTLALQDSSVDLRLLQIPLSITSNTVLREGHASLALLEGEERETTTTRWPLGKLFNGFPSQNRSLHNNSAQLANSISRLTLYAKDVKNHVEVIYIGISSISKYDIFLTHRSILTQNWSISTFSKMNWIFHKMKFVQ